MKEPRKKLGAIYSRSDERYDRQEHGNRQDAEQHVCLGQSPARLRCAGRRINRKGMVHERTPCNVTSSRRKATNVERRSVSSAAHAHLRGRRSSWATPTSLEDMHVPCQLAARHVKKRGWWRNVLEKKLFSLLVRETNGGGGSDRPGRAGATRSSAWSLATRGWSESLHPLVRSTTRVGEGKPVEGGEGVGERSRSVGPPRR